MYALQQAMLYATDGIDSDADLNKPMVGVANIWCVEKMHIYSTVDCEADSCCPAGTRVTRAFTLISASRLRVFLNHGLNSPANPALVSRVK